MVSLPGPGDVVALALLAILGIEAEKVAEAVHEGDLDPLWNQITALNDAEAAAVHGNFTGLFNAAMGEADIVGAAIFDALIDSTLNVKAGAGVAEAGDAIKTLERILGLSAQMPLIFAQVGGIAKLLLGNRAEAFENSAIAHLPEELGLNFFLAEILSSLFKTAVGTPLEEAINVTHHPNRIDSGTIRRLLQQHKISLSTASDYLNRQGYLPDDIPIFLAADQAFLTTSELQELYTYGLIDETTVANNLNTLGYNDVTTLQLTALITKKSQTEGGNFLRSVARSEVEKKHITIDQFVGLLQQANVPDASIQLEVEAIQLLQSTQNQSLTISEIKAAFQNGLLSQDAVMLDLQNFGYNTEDATVLINTWIAEGKKSKTAINENRILSYYLSGVLSSDQAIARLVSQGVTTQDATFLVQHPSTVGSVYRYNLAPATVISALKEDVITVDDATHLLQTLGVEPQAANLEIEIAVKEIQRKNKPKKTEKTLTVGEIEQAYKHDLIADSAVHSELVDFGYSSADADLLFAIWYSQKQGNPPPGWVVIS